MNQGCGSGLVTGSSQGETGVWEKWKHAFALGDKELPEPTAEQLARIDRLCRAIHQRRLTPPALMFLEMSRPLNYLGAQAMHFFEPVATAVFSRDEYQELARFLERRDAIDVIARRLEAFEGGKDSPDSLACEVTPAAPEQESPSC